MLKNHIKIASSKAKNDVNAIRLASMPPTGASMLTAPIDMASNTFLASLKNENTILNLLIMNSGLLKIPFR